MESKTTEKAPRKRGPNYTEAEKDNLRALAKRHKNIIESKCTGTSIFEKKAETWTQLTTSYNALATTGFRTTEQLKHLYENMKQTTRKALATSNKANYLQVLEEKKENRGDIKSFDKSQIEEEVILDLETLKVLDKSDKIDRKKTGGGCFTPAIADKDLKILELIKDQVEPLSNPYDSAAVYFNDNQTEEPSHNNVEEDESMVVVEIIEDDQERNMNEKPNSSFLSENKTTNRSGSKEYKKISGKKLKKGIGSTPGSLKYKNMYFKKKYENALLEQRRLLLDIRLRQKEHLLLAKRIKLEISKLEKET